MQNMVAHETSSISNHVKLHIGFSFIRMLLVTNLVPWALAYKWSRPVSISFHQWVFLGVNGHGPSSSRIKVKRDGLNLFPPNECQRSQASSSRIKVNWDSLNPFPRTSVTGHGPSRPVWFLVPLEFWKVENGKLAPDLWATMAASIFMVIVITSTCTDTQIFELEAEGPFLFINLVLPIKHLSALSCPTWTTISGNFKNVKSASFREFKACRSRKELCHVSDITPRKFDRLHKKNT